MDGEEERPPGCAGRADPGRTLQQASREGVDAADGIVGVIFARWLAEVPEEIRASLERRFPGGFGARDEANALVALAFRNGPLENLHAGIAADIPPEASRISDDEMKGLMIAACRGMERLLRMKAEAPLRYFEEILQANIRFCREWER